MIQITFCKQKFLTNERNKILCCVLFLHIEWLSSIVLQFIHCPSLASDQQRLSQPFFFDFDVLIFLKFRELFLKNGMVVL